MISSTTGIDELLSGRWAISRRGFVAGIGVSGLGMLLAPNGIAAQGTSGTATPATGAALPDDAAAWPKYNLNLGTSEQILAIPAAGDRMTIEFDEYRPWTTIGQFRAEIGKYVDGDVVSGYEQYVFVPIDPSAPDADTFQQLPGLDADEAQQLADGGPYADEEAFLAALGGLVSEEQLALAPAFLASSNAPVATWAKYNLDTITADQIVTIPNAGQQMTHEFDEYRPWATVGQFQKEIGKYVDGDIVDTYLRYLFVPIAVNDADAATLQQLPGVSEEIAKTLVDSQPYADNAAFLTALEPLVSAEQAEAAGGYLATS